MEDLRKQAERFGTDMRFGLVTKMDCSVAPYEVTIDEEKVIAADTVILSTGYKSAPLAPRGKHIHLVGDCSKVGNLRTVIWQAWDIAMKL